MLEQFFKSALTAHRYRSNLLGPYLDSFSDSLLGLGYKWPTVRTQLVLLGTFGRWLSQNEIVVRDLNNQTIDTFLKEQKDQGRLHRSLTTVTHYALTPND